nr:MAG TPA: hypothetical protein [Caudoviricetes sp.]
MFSILSSLLPPVPLPSSFAASTYSHGNLRLDTGFRIS